MRHWFPSNGSALFAAKDTDAPSVFRSEALLRETRRQRGLPNQPVPDICLLDPDGDIVRRLRRGGAVTHPGWACYHTELVTAALPVAATIGVVGCAVGASFAVLVAVSTAEQNQASVAE